MRCRGMLLLCLLCAAFLLQGCGQRIRADVFAVVETGYAPQGATYALRLMDGVPSADAAYLPTLEEQIAPALHAAGYAGPAEPEKADIWIFLGWGASGPLYTYRRAYLDSHPFTRYRRFYGRRSVLVAEEFYVRTLQIVALPHGNVVVSSQSEASPAVPLWEVTVQSSGNLSRAQRLLPELLAAALPWLAKAEQVRVQVDGDKNVTVIEAGE